MQGGFLTQEYRLNQVNGVTAIFFTEVIALLTCSWFFMQLLSFLQELSCQFFLDKLQVFPGLTLHLLGLEQI